MKSSLPLGLPSQPMTADPVTSQETSHLLGEMGCGGIVIEEKEIPNQQPLAKPQPTREWQIFLSTFFTIFLAELGDKTQLTTLLMSAESQSPWIVFAGSGSALVVTSLLGVLIGCWLAKRVSQRTLETAAGTILLFISILLLWDVVGT